MLPVVYPVWLKLPLLWETCQNWLGFSSGNSCWWHCRNTVGLYQWTSRKGECWQGLVALWELQRAQLLQCESREMAHHKCLWCSVYNSFWFLHPCPGAGGFARHQCSPTQLQPLHSQVFSGDPSRESLCEAQKCNSEH